MNTPDALRAARDFLTDNVDQEVLELDAAMAEQDPRIRAIALDGYRLGIHEAAHTLERLAARIEKEEDR